MTDETAAVVGVPDAETVAVGDVGELYRVFSDRLMRIVRCGVRAPEPVIEDACQFAWSRLVHHRNRVRRETALSWLVTTALHEALKLTQREGRDVSLETVIEMGGEVLSRASHQTPQAMVEDRERLGSLTLLPRRQQRLLWLYGVGLTYEEIARNQGCSSRAVERQLQRARVNLRARDGRGEALSSR